MYKQILCDIDGVLCLKDENVSHIKREAKKEQIEELNKLKKEGYSIILDTSRESELREVTTTWLRMNGVEYDKLNMDKPKNDYIIDDKSLKKVTDIRKCRECDFYNELCFGNCSREECIKEFV